MTKLAPSSLTPLSPAILPMSIRCLGWARRSFMAGSRLWPPAKSLASSLYLPRRSSASLTVEALWYSNWAGYMASPLLLRLGSLERRPDPLRRERHGFDVVHTESRERVHHGVHHRRRGGDGARLPRPLDAEGVHRRRRLRAVRLVHGKHVGLGQRIVHHAARHELARLIVVHRAFPQGLGRALRDAPVHHAVYDHGVDHVAHVVHGQVALDRHLARVGIDLDHACMRAEGEAEVRGVVEARLLETGLEPLGEVVRNVRGERDGAEGHRLAGGTAHLELPARVLDVARGGFQEVSGDLLALLLDLVHRHLERGAAHGSGPAAIGAHAERDGTRVAVDHLDLVDGNLEIVGHELGAGRLVPLPVRVRARVHGDHAGWVYPHLARFVEPGASAEGAHHLGRRDGARLDVGGEADAEVAGAGLYESGKVRVHPTGMV